MAATMSHVVVETYRKQDPASYRAAQREVQEIDQSLNVPSLVESRRLAFEEAGFEALRDAIKIDPELIEASAIYGEELPDDEVARWCMYLPTRAELKGYRGIEPPDEAVEAIKVARQLDYLKLQLWSNERESMVVGTYRKTKKDAAHYFPIVRWGLPQGKARTLPTLKQIRQRQVKKVGGITGGVLLAVAGIVLALVFLVPWGSRPADSTIANSPSVTASVPPPTSPSSPVATGEPAVGQAPTAQPTTPNTTPVVAAKDTLAKTFRPLIASLLNILTAMRWLGIAMLPLGLVLMGSWNYAARKLGKVVIFFGLMIFGLPFVLGIFAA